MTPVSTIFCDPAYQTDLEKHFPKCKTVSFSQTPENCAPQIDTLGLRAGEDVVLLFKSLSGESNTPVIDHINLSTENPLIGPADLSKGPRFPDMSSVYENTGRGVVVVLGDDPDLEKLDEEWAPVESGVWEAITLKHHGHGLHAWLINDLEKWVREQSIIN